MDRQRIGILVAALTVLLALSGAGTVPAARGAAAYTITEIGTLGGPTSLATDVNATGQVVGAADTAAGQSHAFLWADGVLTDLGTLGGPASLAEAINARGQVVGMATTAPGQQLGGPGSHAFLWQGGRMTDLGTLGGPASEATDINDAGQVVGGATLAPGQQQNATGNHGFLWAEGRLADLGALPGGTTSRANGLNNRGQVVGISSGGTGTPLAAVRWQSGQPTDLGALPGAGVMRAFAINDAGQVAGRAADAPEQARPDTCPAARRCTPVLYRDGTWVALPTPPDAPNGAAFALNNAGQVVGAAQTAQGAVRALLWNGGAATDLNALLPAESGWVLTVAWGINDAGQIVGAGTHNGQQRGFLLTPAAMPGLPNTGGGGTRGYVPRAGWPLVGAAGLALLAAGARRTARRRAGAARRR